MKKFILKDLIIKNFLVATLLLSSPIYAQIQLLDRVIAVVDSGVIMESQLNDRVQSIVFRLRQNGTELPPKNDFEMRVLKR